MTALRLACVPAILFMLGCGGFGSGLAERDGPAPSVPVPTVVTTPAPVPSAGRLTAEAATALRADPVAAYLADCHAAMPPDPEIVWEEAYPPEGDECAYRQFEQNCSPDPFGCWDKGETCRDACGAPCSTCQTACGATCDGCKAACGSDGDCLRRCATERSTCRDACMSEAETCRGHKCSSFESACMTESEAKKVQACPDCEAITECEVAAMEAGQDWQTCNGRFPGNAPECVSWCSPGL